MDTGEVLLLTKIVCNFSKHTDVNVIIKEKENRQFLLTEICYLYA